MIEKLSFFFNYLNTKGIPIPLGRDPITGTGSITFTMVGVSFLVCLLLLAGKVANLIGGVDFDNALWLLGLSLGSYLGRQYQKNGKQITLGEPIKTTESTKDAGTSK